MSKSKKIRRYDIDWLRVIAIFQIFLLHVACIFTFWPYPVKNNELTLEMTILSDFLLLWPMPLFFIISGASTFYALGFRKPKQFIQERIRRIAIPFIFGIFVIIPPLIYIERLSSYQFSGTYLQFYPHYFNGLHLFGGNFSWWGHHLWYLLLLFIFSLITLPLLIYLRTGEGRNAVSKLAIFFDKTGAIFLFALPIMILEMVLNPLGLGLKLLGGWNVFAYIFYFIYGYLIFSNLRFQNAIKKNWKISLVLGLITTVLVEFLFYILLLREKGFLYLSGIAIEALSHGVLGNILIKILIVLDPLHLGLRALSSWLWIIAILGWSSIYLNKKTKFLKYANEAVLPFYILHLTVQVVIGFYIVQWNVGIAEKFILISIISLATILAIYGLVIRPFNVMRFLFGMKPKKT